MKLLLKSLLLLSTRWNDQQETTSKAPQLPHWHFLKVYIFDFRASHEHVNSEDMKYMYLYYHKKQTCKGYYVAET